MSDSRHHRSVCTRTTRETEMRNKIITDRFFSKLSLKLNWLLFNLPLFFLPEGVFVSGLNCAVLCETHAESSCRTEDHLKQKSKVKLVDLSCSLPSRWYITLPHTHMCHIHTYNMATFYRLLHTRITGYDFNRRCCERNAESASAEALQKYFASWTVHIRGIPGPRIG